MEHGTDYFSLCARGWVIIINKAHSLPSRRSQSSYETTMETSMYNVTFAAEGMYCVSFVYPSIKQLENFPVRLIAELKVPPSSSAQQDNLIEVRRRGKGLTGHNRVGDCLRSTALEVIGSGTLLVIWNMERSRG